LAIVCAATFACLQFYGFSQLIASGNYFTGPTSNVTSSFVFLIAAFHLLHALAGLLCLVVVFIKLLNKKYQSDNMLGFELAVNFWHFVDVLWIYLFLFLVFFI
jgi:cytochrome c oxidase subunit 3